MGAEEVRRWDIEKIDAGGRQAAQRRLDLRRVALPALLGRTVGNELEAELLCQCPHLFLCVALRRGALVVEHAERLDGGQVAEHRVQTHTFRDDVANAGEVARREHRCVRSGFRHQLRLGRKGDHGEHDRDVQDIFLGVGVLHSADHCARDRRCLGVDQVRLQRLDFLDVARQARSVVLHVAELEDGIDAVRLQVVAKSRVGAGTRPMHDHVDVERLGLQRGHGRCGDGEGQQERPENQGFDFVELSGKDKLSIVDSV